MSATNLKVYSRPLEEQNSNALNGYFPCGLLVFYDLVSTAQQQLTACRKLKKKCILSTHTKILNTAVKALPEILHDVHKEKKFKHNEMRMAVWRAKPRQAVPKGLITNAASFFRHHKQTRICSKRESNSKKNKTLTFIFRSLHQHLMSKKVNALVLRALVLQKFSVPKSLFGFDIAGKLC